jgi:hypothetical protein
LEKPPIVVTANIYFTLLKSIFSIKSETILGRDQEYTGKTKPTFSDVAIIDSCFIRLAIGRSSQLLRFSLRHLAVCNEFPVPEK